MTIQEQIDILSGYKDKDQEIIVSILLTEDIIYQSRQLDVTLTKEQLSFIMSELQSIATYKDCKITSDIISNTILSSI